tara:strand:- start:3371 stop:3586 length:216 start_codon:yes stop_codon:yes gene_type:complete
VLVPSLYSRLAIEIFPDFAAKLVNQLGVKIAQESFASSFNADFFYRCKNFNGNSAIDRKCLDQTFSLDNCF